MVVMDLMFRCVDGAEHASRDPGVGSAKTKLAPGTSLGGLVFGQRQSEIQSVTEGFLGESLAF
jgi:hypothetical protein